MSQNTIADYLAENPKMTGVLFTMLLLLSQAGSVIAAKSSAYPGP